MTIEKFISIVESFDFIVHEYEEDDVLRGYELETWTNGGVDMLLFIDCRNCPEVSVEFVIEELERNICSFSVDEEIDLHRQGKAYRNDFTIRESLEDFEEYEARLGDLLKAVKEAYNQCAAQKTEEKIMEKSYNGEKIYCPYCGEEIVIEFDEARCDECGWFCGDGELDELMEC